MILLAASKKDQASLNIAKRILHNYQFNKTSDTFQGSPVHSTAVNGRRVCFITLKEEAVKAQIFPHNFQRLGLIVFVSRHSSASGTPTLSVHTPGNINAAELGGLPRKISISPAIAMKTALKALFNFKREMNLDYDVSYECTHHGPSLNVPTMFVELGSSAKQWSDLQAAEAVAHATMTAISNFKSSEYTAALGIGGPHYNQRFTQMALNDEAVFSHMIPKYAVQHLDAEILSQCVERTVEKVDRAILDWKGIKGVDKPTLLTALQEIGLRYTKV